MQNSQLCHISSLSTSVGHRRAGHRWAPLGTVGQAALVGGTMGGMLRENLGALADFSVSGESDFDGLSDLAF